jgi:hypothetical protein
MASSTWPTQLLYIGRGSKMTVPLRVEKYLKLLMPNTIVVYANKALTSLQEIIDNMEVTHIKDL